VFEHFGEMGQLPGCPPPGCGPAAIHLPLKAQNEFVELLNDKSLQLEISKQILLFLDKNKK